MKRIIYILLSLIILVGGESFAAKGKGKKLSKKKYSKTAVHKKKTTYKKKAVKAKSPGKFVADTTKMRKIVQATPAIEAFESNPYGDSDDNFAHENDVYTEDPNFDVTGLQDSINVNPYKIHFSQLEDSVTFTLIDNFECDYHHPFKGNVTSNFGPRWKRYHMGTDIDLETGDTVYCAFEGIVRIARRSSSFGNVVMVRHKNGLETIYAHLSALNVRNGDHVEAGTIIGLGGNTGHSFGSHLHFEVRYKGYPVDPNKLIAFDEFRPKCEKITLYKEDFNVYAQAKANTTKHKSQLKYYKVRKGDTLYSIARKLGTTTKVLQRLNHLGRSSSIKKGKVLKYV